MQPEAAESFERECLRCKTVFAVRSVHSPDRFCQKCSETEQKRTDCPLCGKARPSGLLRLTGGLCEWCASQRRIQLKAQRRREQRARNPDWEEQELDYRAKMARQSIEYYERAASWSRGIQSGEMLENEGEGGSHADSESEWSQLRRAALPEHDPEGLPKMLENESRNIQHLFERQQNITLLNEDERGAVTPNKPEWEQWTREHGPYTDGKLPWERRKKRTP
jgi:hypothetical protein